ncbi:hypothetical protein P2G88_01115 [Aliiglaciecola sp. CAU 1673]|uniref:hypothetical protein n=1 Tax=Aliiglaciecola sp. CAU 1673 TaxID=3032595 RepID=UPI0023D9AF82|nr:hypothetical protein [Aliiglaciecola sp. CAU 1673]MDF2176850.1 hypothetical protein [Aliiglaciecola sp. CAU 1673]
MTTLNRLGRQVLRHSGLLVLLAGAFNAYAAAPTLNFTWNPSTIYSGDVTYRTWSSTNAHTCIGNNGSSVGTSGSSVPRSQTSSMSVTMTCYGTGGSVSKTATLTVLPRPPAPTVSVWWSPSVITEGDYTSVSHSSTNATSCVGTNGNAVPTNKTGPMMQQSASKTVTITCTGPGGTGSGSATLTVLPRIPATPSTPSVPSIVNQSQSFTVSWNGVADASKYELYRDGVKVQTVTGTSATESLSSFAEYSYQVRACNSSNQCSSQSGSNKVRVSRINGYIDGVSQSGGDAFISGWACQMWDTRSVDVQVWAGGSSASGTRVAIAKANSASSAAVASECRTSGSNYRFSVLIPRSERVLHGGKTLYVHGVSLIGGTHNTLGNSGAHTLPGISAPDKPAYLNGPSEAMESQSFTLTRPSESYVTYKLYRNGQLINSNMPQQVTETLAAGTYNYELEACNEAGCQAQRATLTVMVKVPSVVKGRVGWLSQSGDLHYVHGWACQTYDNGSINVQVWAGGASAPQGSLIAQGVASEPSEDAVEQECHTSSAVHRFKIWLPDEQRKLYGEKALYLRGVSSQGTGDVVLDNSGTLMLPAIPLAQPAAPSGAETVATGVSFTLSWTADPNATSYKVYQNGVLLDSVAGNSFSHGLDQAGEYAFQIESCNTACSVKSPELTITAIQSIVRGIADGLTEESGTYYMNGWACQMFDTNPINVKLFTNGGTQIGFGKADMASEKAVDDLCYTQGSHRFKIPLDAALITQLAGLPIHIQGQSNNGSGSVYLFNSGQIYIPTAGGITGWDSENVRVGETFNLINAPAGITACQLDSQPDFVISVSDGVAISYSALTETGHAWTCLDGSGQEVLKMTSPLTIGLLQAPTLEKE